MSNVRLIAKMAGVSASTVSRVLTGKAPVRPQTRQRIIQAISDCNYQAKKGAEAVSLSVGIVMPKRSGDNLSGHPAFYSATSLFIEEMTLRNVKNEIIVFDDSQLRNLDSLFLDKIDGYFILGTSQMQEDAIISYMKTNRRPYIILNRWVNEKFVSYANVDDTQAAYNATEYLIRQGHRDIAFIGGNEDFRNSKLRIEGYTQALLSNGIEPDRSLLFQGTYTEHYGYEIAESFTSLKHKPSAALFSSDMIAVGFLAHGRELGIEVPRDLSIIGWGDFSIASYVQPPLTTVHIPNAELGAQAARMLYSMMTTKDLLMMQALMDAKLVIRASVAPRKLP